MQSIHLDREQALNEGRARLRMSDESEHRVQCSVKLAPAFIRFSSVGALNHLGQNTHVGSAGADSEQEQLPRKSLQADVTKPQDLDTKSRRIAEIVFCFFFSLF